MKLVLSVSLPISPCLSSQRTEVFQSAECTGSHPKTRRRISNRTVSSALQVLYNKSIFQQFYTPYFKVTLLPFTVDGPHAEIDNFQILIVLFQEHNVFRLQVAVHDIFGVAVRNGRKQLLEIVPALVFS
jgi:hypothetical protein